MRPRLAFLILLTLATIYPVPSCRYKTYAQEPGDIVAVDSNAGIMTLAAGDIAYKSFDALIKAKAASDYYWWGDVSANVGTTRAETYRYDYILKDIPDDDDYDSWYYYGCLIGYTKPENGSTWSWNRFVFSGELHKMSTGAWAVKKFTVAFGLPAYSGTNVYNVTYDEGANFFTQYVACLRKAFELQKVENNDQNSIFNVDGRYDNYINWVEHDTDNGGVNNLAEWVRGTLINDVYDDKPQGGKCLCGACCECECKCGRWDGLTCNGTATDCDCHAQEPECTCISYCCACKCECEKCADGTHSLHENGSDTCDGTDDDTIGFAGCDCHKEEEPEADCACANYCCKHTCACEKCGDGEHSAHKNDNGSCDGTPENCSDCHEEENPEEETCACANYCCACKCECKRCKAAGSCSGVHQNRDSKCDGVASGSNYVCDCHKTDNPENPEETSCTCANYCCYHTCECKRCASFSAENHSQHKNGSPTCNGTTDSGGCSCHASTGDENDKVEFPEDQDYEVPEEKKKDSFLPSTDLNDVFGRLKTKIAQKFGLEKLSNLLGGDLSGKLPSWSFRIPPPIGETVVLNLNKMSEYSFFSLFRCVLVFWVYYFTAITVFNSLRQLL